MVADLAGSLSRVTISRLGSVLEPIPPDLPGFAGELVPFVAGCTQRESAFNVKPSTVHGKQVIPPELIAIELRLREARLRFRASGTTMSESVE
jgi:hypothetical protein